MILGHRFFNSTIDIYLIYNTYHHLSYFHLWNHFDKITLVLPYATNMIVTLNNNSVFVSGFTLATVILIN